MDREEITGLLQSKGKEQEELFALARKKMEENFGNKAFMRAVVEISNHCRCNCDYCGMRRDNKDLARYRIAPAEVIETAMQVKESGINALFLQAGEEPQTTEIAEAVLPQIKALGLTAILCLGNKTYDEYRRLRDAGADKYILKHETSDAEWHEAIRHKPLKERLQCLEWLLELGYKVGTGTIVGLPGQSMESIADDILLARKYGVHMVSASPFIPHDKTPLRNIHYGDLDLTLNTIALMRLILPDALIPTVSALEILEQGGQVRGFDAGANVITVNATPQQYRKKYLIYTTGRKIVDMTHAESTIENAGLKLASMAE